MSTSGSRAEQQRNVFLLFPNCLCLLLGVVVNLFYELDADKLGMKHDILNLQHH